MGGDYSTISAIAVKLCRREKRGRVWRSAIPHSRAQGPRVAVVDFGAVDPEA